MIVLLELILLLFCLYPPMEWRSTYESIIGLCFLSLMFSFEIGRRLHWSVGVAFFILLFSGLYTFFFPSKFPIPTDPFLVERGAGETLYSLVTLLLFAFALLLKSGKFFRLVLRTLFYCAVLDSLILIFNKLVLKQTPPYAMLNNGTADGAFITCLLPIAFEELRIFSICAIIVAVLFTRSNTAFAAIWVAIAFWFLQEWPIRKWLVKMVPVTLLMLFIAWFHLGNHFLVNSGRFQLWHGSWNFYRQFANLWTGFGTGTFTSWGIAVQRTAHLTDKEPFILWGWLHLEPLEILFENGVLGLLSALIVYGFILKRTFKKSVVFPIACVYGFISFTEMPLRLWVTQVLGICLVSEAFKTDQLQVAPENAQKVVL